MQEQATPRQAGKIVREAFVKSGIPFNSIKGVTVDFTDLARVRPVFVLVDIDRYDEKTRQLAKELDQIAREKGFKIHWPTVYQPEQ